MYCPKCGTELKEGVTVCPQCEESSNKNAKFILGKKKYLVFLIIIPIAVLVLVFSKTGSSTNQAKHGDSANEPIYTESTYAEGQSETSSDENLNKSDESSGSSLDNSNEESTLHLSSPEETVNTFLEAVYNSDAGAIRNMAGSTKKNFIEGKSDAEIKVGLNQINEFIGSKDYPVEIRKDYSADNMGTWVASSTYDALQHDLYIALIMEDGLWRLNAIENYPTLLGTSSLLDPSNYSPSQNGTSDAGSEGTAIKEQKYTTMEELESSPPSIFGEEEDIYKSIVGAWAGDDIQYTFNDNKTFTSKAPIKGSDSSGFYYIEDYDSITVWVGSPEKMSNLFQNVKFIDNNTMEITDPTGHQYKLTRSSSLLNPTSNSSPSEPTTEKSSSDEVNEDDISGLWWTEPDADGYVLMLGLESSGYLMELLPHDGFKTGTEKFEQTYGTYAFEKSNEGYVVILESATNKTMRFKYINSESDGPTLRQINGDTVFKRQLT